MISTSDLATRPMPASTRMFAATLLPQETYDTAVRNANAGKLALDAGTDSLRARGKIANQPFLCLALRHPAIAFLSRHAYRRDLEAKTHVQLIQEARQNATSAVTGARDRVRRAQSVMWQRNVRLSDGSRLTLCDTADPSFLPVEEAQQLGDACSALGTRFHEYASSTLTSGRRFSTTVERQVEESKGLDLASVGLIDRVRSPELHGTIDQEPGMRLAITLPGGEAIPATTVVGALLQELDACARADEAFDGSVSIPVTPQVLCSPLSSPIKLSAQLENPAETVHPLSDWIATRHPIAVGTLPLTA